MLDMEMYVESGHPSLAGLCFSRPHSLLKAFPSVIHVNTPRVSANDHRADFSSCFKVMCLSSSQLAVFKCLTGHLAENNLNISTVLLSSPDFMHAHRLQ